MRRVGAFNHALGHNLINKGGGTLFTSDAIQFCWVHASLPASGHNNTGGGALVLSGLRLGFSSAECLVACTAILGRRNMAGTG